MRIVNDSEHCRRWWIGSRAGDAVKNTLDANADGIVTAGDFLAWAVYIFHLPAYTGMIIVDSFPLVAQFFGVDCQTGFGWGGTVVSLMAWVFLAYSVVASSRSAEKN